jgi:hypothetical protein
MFEEQRAAYDPEAELRNFAKNCGGIIVETTGPGWPRTNLRQPQSEKEWLSWVMTRADSIVQSTSADNSFVHLNPSSHLHSLVQVTLISAICSQL